MSAESDHLDFSSPTVPVSAVFVAADEPLLVFSTAGDALKALLIRYLEAQRQRVSDTMPLSELTAAVWTIERQELHGARSSAWSCLLGVVAIGALLVVLFKLV